MFEFGRDLRRLWSSKSGALPGDVPRHSEGLTGGDLGLLDLLNISMLEAEARAGDVAAGRIGAKDRPALTLQAARIWRELARRNGDPITLRRAAARAETAARAFREAGREPETLIAHVEQALCAMLGADLFGDHGLDAAASSALAAATRAPGLARVLADLVQAALGARQATTHGDIRQVMAAIAAFDQPLLALKGPSLRYPAVRRARDEARLMRIEAMAESGARLRHNDLLEVAHRDAIALASGLDPDFDPLTHARACALQGNTLRALGHVTGEVARLADGVSALARALDSVPLDHSPLDWAKIQIQLGTALQALGESLDEINALEQAITAFDRAHSALRTRPSLALGAIAANGRAVCLARLAELTGDLAVLDIAEAAFKTELADIKPSLEPVAWAVAQVNLAQVYEARASLTRRQGGERARARLALSSALDVFGEHGLHSLSDLVLRGLERLREPHRESEARGH